MHRRKAYRSGCQHEKNDLCIHAEAAVHGQHDPIHISRRLLPRRTDRSTGSDEKNVPHRASDNCKQQKFRHLHPCHPGGDGNEASDDGNAPAEQNGPLAFLLKILFTALTIGAGFKGGEIIPTFFIGSTLGCALGGLLGLDPGFAAALGLVGVFCGVVNCPLASLLLSIELFGSESLPLFALVCAISYLLSGYYSLYAGQKIIYSKLRTEYINQDTH